MNEDGESGFRIPRTGTIAVVLILVTGAYIAGRSGGSDSQSEGDGAASNAMSGHEHAEHKTPTIWTCSMHPQIQLPEPGDCPICGMDLIPLTDDAGSDDSERRLVMSPASVKLAEIQTAPVERKFVQAEIRMVGRVDYDETRLKKISAWVGGRIDRLYVDYTGISVSEGDHLVWLYSPDLFAAQEELLEIARRLSEGGEQRSEFLRDSDQRALESAREKLRLWGLSEKQIEEIEARDTAEAHMLINSPVSGIVVHKALTEGEYVKTGTHVYTVADLGRVWVMLDAYESDLPWLRYGQHVEIETEAWPGEIFEGIVAFIDPILDTKTRTVKIRVNVENSDGRLKPGMYARTTVHSSVAMGGRVMDADLSGKWISPMHPEIVSDNAGDCPVCHMPLVKAEELGYVAIDDEESMPLVVPATAVLRTGERAVVYVKVRGSERPAFDGRELTLGPRAGDYYLVREGLTEGEEVVVNGNFNIDSSLQIKARPSMMSMPAQGATRHMGSDHLRRLLKSVYDAYLAAQEALASDKVSDGVTALKEMRSALEGIDARELEGRGVDQWSEKATSLVAILERAAARSDLPALRRDFARASSVLLDIEDSFGHMAEEPYYEMYCPMALDGEGARWFQNTDELRNPYYGASMLSCGQVKTHRAPHKAAPKVGGMAGHQH